MSWKFTSNKPIFQQLVEMITNDIVSGKYVLGQKLPTVRDLAMEAGVNPNTLQKAFSLIEQTGLIYTKRGEGRYVCENAEIVKTQAYDLLYVRCKEFVHSISAMGASDEVVLEIVETLLKGEQ